ncbi:MAG: FliH/SctL family protein [Betaproteobacteria bacterium]
MSKKVIKASNLVLGATPITVAAAWSASRWEEVAVAGPLEETEDGAETTWETPAEAAGKGDPELETSVALAQERAAAILQEAQLEADRLVAEARSRSAQVLEEARREGYQAGFREGEEKGLAEGLAKAEREMEAAVKQTMKVLAAAIHEKQRIVASSRDDVLKLVRKVAERIIRAEVRLDPNVVERAIDASLALVAERSQVLIRVNPEDLTRAREGVPHFLRYFSPSAVLEVCADSRVTQGGCLIETNAGNIDARVETQLEEVFGKLEEALHGG